MFECDSNDESEVLMTRVIDALGATGGDNCSDHMEDVGHDVEETKLSELNNLIQQIILTATPGDVDVTSKSMESGHKQQMEDSPNLAWQESPHHNQVVEQFQHGNSDVNDKDLSGQDELEDKKVCAMTAELSKIKEDLEDLESDLKKLIEEKLDVEKNKMFEIDQLKKENQAKTDEAEALITQKAVEIENLKMEMDEIKAYNEALRSDMAEKNERAIKVLTNANVKIQKVELENRELQKQLDAMKAAFEAQINKAFKLEKEMKMLKRNSDDKNEQLMKLGKKFMEVLNIAENENSPIKKPHPESEHQRPSSMSNEHQSQNPCKLFVDGINPCKLFVDGIDEHIQNHEMVAEFGKYGTVTDAFNRGRGYAVITYSSPADAQDCLTNANGKRMFGKKIETKETCNARNIVVISKDDDASP